MCNLVRSNYLHFRRFSCDNTNSLCSFSFPPNNFPCATRNDERYKWTFSIGPQNSPIKTNQFADLNPNATKVIPPWAVDVPDGPHNQFASTSHGHQISKDRTEVRTRAPLISVYRGEAPVRSKSQTEINRASKPPHDGGLFQVYTSTKQRAPYYVIHPEWLSEPMSIKQLELFPRSSAGLATSKRASNPRPNNTNLSRRLNHTTSHGESKSAPVNRCRSMPCKPINPITWEPWSRDGTQII